ncbi:MAG TPA: hypothetical protein VJT72_21670 [Pseudonocardiaceae bacterium]|nr:hypothetical protein [Pseudonocardiaceae bacterium]
MDLLAAIRIAVRRWYILAPLVVLSLLGSLAVRNQVQPSYDVDGLMPIVAPYVSTQESADQLKRNNFVEVGGTSGIMATLGDSAEVRLAVGKRGGDPSYVIGSTSGSVTVSVKTDSMDRALATYRIVREELSVRLDTLQRNTGVPAAFRVTLSDALAPTGGLALTTGKSRAMIASLGLGLVLSFATCVFIDYLLSRRRRDASRKNLGMSWTSDNQE